MVALRCFTNTELLWQHAKIWLPWQQGWVGANLNDTVKLADLENPQFGTRICDISPILVELEPVLCPNTQICVMVTFTDSHSPYCKSRSLTSLVHIARMLMHCPKKIAKNGVFVPQISFRIT